MWHWCSIYTPSSAKLFVLKYNFWAFVFDFFCVAKVYLLFSCFFVQKSCKSTKKSSFYKMPTCPFIRFYMLLWRTAGWQIQTETKFSSFLTQIFFGTPQRHLSAGGTRVWTSWQSLNEHSCIPYVSWIFSLSPVGRIIWTRITIKI